MKYRIIKISLLLLFIILLNSCSQKKINAKFTYLAIMKRASMVDQFPKGFIQFGTMVEEDEKFLITSDKMKENIKSIEFIYPDGSKKIIDTQNVFQTNSQDFWSGYSIMGIVEKQCVFTGVDTKYNSEKLPLEGIYTWVLTSQSGNKSESKFEYKNNSAGEITGFPEQTKFDQNTRLVSWKGLPDNSIRYRVYLFKGEKPEKLEDWTNLVFTTTPAMVTGNKFILPDFVKLEKGQKYYFLVEAWRIPYFNVQDKKDQIASFIAQ